MVSELDPNGKSEIVADHLSWMEEAATKSEVSKIVMGPEEAIAEKIISDLSGSPHLSLGQPRVKLLEEVQSKLQQQHKILLLSEDKKV